MRLVGTRLKPRMGAKVICESLDPALSTAGAARVFQKRLLAVGRFGRKSR